eukprot:m.11671 g.11671  ORF g.11671 m.11671 type:complete len:721 (+) comp23541_c0_seq1:86-2248(+)
MTGLLFTVAFVLASFLVFQASVSGETIEPWAIENPRKILVDVATKGVIVGAKDVIYRFEIGSFETPPQEANISVTSDEATICSYRGSTKECYNFPKVILSLPNHTKAALPNDTSAVVDDKTVFPNETGAFLFCSTHALTPKCEYRSLTNVSKVLSPAIKEQLLYSYCPYTQYSSNLAMFSSSGDFFAATHMMIGQDTAWFKLTALGDQYPVRTLKHNDAIDTNAVLIKMFEDEQFMYLAYREKGMELPELDEPVISRIARICKNDTGTGSASLLSKNSFLSFLKTRLKCETSSGYTYDELVSFSDSFILDGKTVFLGVFNNVESGPPASAICLYTFDSVKSAYDGVIRKTKLLGDKDDTTTKGVDCSNPRPIADAVSYNLMEVPLKQQGLPIEVKYMTRPEEKYAALAVLPDVDYDGKTCTLLFIGTDDGKLKRTLVCNRVLHPLNDVVVDPSGGITTIASYQPEDKSQTSIFMLSSSQVTSHLVYGCSYKQQSACVSDLLCAWNCESRSCTPRPKNCTSGSCGDLKIASLDSCPATSQPTEPSVTSKPKPTDKRTEPEGKTPKATEPKNPTEKIPTETQKPPVEPTGNAVTGNDGGTNISTAVVAGIACGCAVLAFLVGLLIGLFFKRPSKSSDFGTATDSGKVEMTFHNRTPDVPRRVNSVIVNEGARNSDLPGIVNQKPGLPNSPSDSGMGSSPSDSNSSGHSDATATGKQHAYENA